jgi:hypothetical protein
MSTKQSRRGVSLSSPAHRALVAHAARENVTAAELVTRALRAYGVAIPETRHRTRAAAEHAVAARIDAPTAPVVVRPKPLPLRRGPAPKAAKVPSRNAIETLLAECRRGVNNLYSPDPSQREAAKRRVSIRFAHELRKRGWLLPENEGAAPGSWWTPAKRSA